MSRMTYRQARALARRARREGLDPLVVAPPVGKLRDVFMEEYETPKRNWREEPPHCRNCWGEGELVAGDVIYPHRPDLYHKKFWLCRPCNAYVGVHERSEFSAPMGLMATAEHRALKIKAHAVFDGLWKNGGPMTRSEAYTWLRDAMNSDKNIHIGWSTIEQLEEIIKICTERTHGKRNSKV